MTVKAGDEVLDSNYTEESIAKNYVQAYTHSNSSATVDGSSYFQNMYEREAHTLTTSVWLSPRWML